MLTIDHVIGGLIVAILFLLICLIRICYQAIKKLNRDEPEDDKFWTVGDFKTLFELLPDSMPVILLDTTTDDAETCNYRFTNQEIEINNYYLFNTDEYSKGNPAGKALYLNFENVLNENPIN